MFGMGFTEILFIAVVAILFLGPDKLPDAMVQIAKLFKNIRSTINDAKSSFEEEIKIKELREEALGYRKKLEAASEDIAGFKNAMPNPAAELQNAITSIGTDRLLDDTVLSDIETAQSTPPAETVSPNDAPKKEGKKEKKSSKKKKKKKTKDGAEPLPDPDGEVRA